MSGCCMLSAVVHCCMCRGPGCWLRTRGGATGHWPRLCAPRGLHMMAAKSMDLLLGAGLGLVVAALLPLAAGHGAMVTPRSRNSIDFDEKVSHFPASGGGSNWAWCTNMTGAGCNNGQAAYWYSQGCFIGCPSCDHQSGRRQTDLCGNGFIGMLPGYAVAVNRNVERNGPLDIYRHNPWRAPGYAPVADACGRERQPHSRTVGSSNLCGIHQIDLVALVLVQWLEAHRGPSTRRKKAVTSTRLMRTMACEGQISQRCRRAQSGRLEAQLRYLLRNISTHASCCCWPCLATTAVLHTKSRPHAAKTTFKFLSPCEGGVECPLQSRRWILLSPVPCV